MEQPPKTPAYHDLQASSVLIGLHWLPIHDYSKPVLSGHSKIDKTRMLMTNGTIMKVENIAECYPLGAFCNTFDLH